MIRVNAMKLSVILIWLVLRLRTLRLLSDHIHKSTAQRLCPCNHLVKTGFLGQSWPIFSES